MGKGVIIGLVVLVLILGSLYYYFFIHAQNVKTQEFLKLVDDYVESLESLGGQSFVVIDASDLDYYRYACEFEISSIYDSEGEKDVILQNANCDWDKASELLSEVPEDDFIKQGLYTELSSRNAVRILFKSFNENVKDIHSRKGLSSGANSEMLAYLVLVFESGQGRMYSGGMLASCLQKHNKTVRCLPVLTEAESKASGDLLEEINFGENFISECMQSKILSAVPLPPEISGINLNRENCGRVAEIYQGVFDDVKDEDMDVNGKFMILNTFYLISKSFGGQKPGSDEAINEFNDMMKSYTDTEFSDIFEKI